MYLWYFRLWVKYKIVHVYGIWINNRENSLICFFFRVNFTNLFFYWHLRRHFILNTLALSNFSRYHFSSRSLSSLNDLIKNLQIFIYFSLLIVTLFRSCLVHVGSLTDWKETQTIIIDYCLRSSNVLWVRRVFHITGWIHIWMNVWGLLCQRNRPLEVFVILRRFKAISMKLGKKRKKIPCDKRWIRLKIKGLRFIGVVFL